MRKFLYPLLMVCLVGGLSSCKFGKKVDLIMNDTIVASIDSMASNPFITHMYTADPSAHVWEDGRLYVYA